MHKSNIDNALERIDAAVSSLRSKAAKHHLASLLPVNKEGAEEALMRSVLDTIPAMVWVKRIPDGFVMLCNDAGAEVGGTTREHMEGTLPEKWWPASFTERWKLDDNEVAATGHAKVNYLERILHPKSKQVRWVRTSKYPMLDDCGEVRAVLVFSYDVTEIVPPEMRKGYNEDKNGA